MSSSEGETRFVQFCTTLANVYNLVPYNNRDLAHVASYFWNRFTDHHKGQWKIAAALHSQVHHLTGKHKMRGFWYFAIALESAWANYETGLYYHVWQNMRPEEIQAWGSEGAAEQAVDRIINSVDNMTL